MTATVTAAASYTTPRGTTDGRNIRDLGMAYLLAIVIGWNREKESQGAGLRTFPLVAIASCGFVQISEGMMDDNPEAAARVVADVITGIGFIGAGAIMKGGSEIHGTATAAAYGRRAPSVWRSRSAATMWQSPSACSRW